ncbi:hypothetical protein BJX70DRAFT_388833 [Aspergillus crustosus]
MLRTIDCSHMLAMDIHVQTPTSSGVTAFASFATGEKINGPFDNLLIAFLGEQSTSIPTSSPSKAYHQFLNLVQEIPEEDLPYPRVTDYLPSSMCSHSAHPLVKAAHLHPPPSCGDASIAGFGGKLRDDFAPAACKVAYSIYAKLERPSVTTGLQETIMERRVKVRVKPAVGEVPVPEISSSLSDEYSLYREETILDPSSKNTPLGRLVVTLEQPSCLISKAVRIFFVYHKANVQSARPPSELRSLKAQIIATTIYTTDLNEPHPIARKRDFFKKPINFRDAETYSAYTATLLVPVTLPKDKSFIPTFHSCLMSRVYSLDFQISVQHSSSVVKLRVPMQIAAERDPSALPSYNASLGADYTAD